MNFLYKKIFFAVFLVWLFFGVFLSPVLASTTDGTIDATNRYAWSENAGWIDFGSTAGNVHVTDSALTGYAWGENIGWISLNCSNTSSCATVDYKISNNSEGTLTGYAWGENVGWIQFNPSAGGVTIDSSGNFSGYTWGENVGWISFNCSNTSSCATVSYYVATDWRPASSRSSGSGSSGGGSVGVPASYGGPPPGAPPPTVPPTSPPPESLESEKPSVIDRVSETIDAIIPDFLRPKPKPQKPPAPPVQEAVALATPLPFRGTWMLMDPTPLKKFVLAPLPKEIVLLRKKFPSFEKTLNDVGIGKITDLKKLRSVELALPGITKTGGLTLPRGIPTPQFSKEVKKKLPSEFVFVRSGKGLIDMETKLFVNDKGKPQQKIHTLAGESLKLIVKPDGKTKSVKGYVVFKRKVPQKGTLEYQTRPLAAALFLARPALAERQELPVETSEEFVLVEFNYVDPDGDGIYAADVDIPVVDGEYEVITVLDYADPSLGIKEIRLVTVIDPEGYVYEKIGDKEARIPEASITLLVKDLQTQQYAPWPAKNYEQQNPQTTDVRGTYAFLVPEGDYRLRVETSGYLPFEGESFSAEEGDGVHMNIELTPTNWWWKALDLRTITLIALALFLTYNFYRDRKKRS